MAGGYSDESRWSDREFIRMAGHEEYSGEYFNDSDMESDLADYGVYPIEDLDEEQVKLALDGYSPTRRDRELDD